MSGISKNAGWYALILGLIVTLGLLGFLQYHSSRQLSQATSEQMRLNLQASLMNLRRGVENELWPICRTFQHDMRTQAGDEPERVAASYREWRSLASHPALISEILIWRPESKELVRLDAAKSAFEPAP